MNAKQVELANLIISEMGETVIQVGKDNGARFFIGTVETPFGDQNFVVITGKEVTSFFGASAMMKTKEQTKLDITTFLTNTAQMVIKTSPNTEWYSYSRL